MAANEDMLIRVHGSWNGWQNAEVRLANIRGLHWCRPDRAPRALLFGFISCTDIVSGNIPHACDRASAPHDLLVCVLKRHVVSSAYAALAESAEEVGARVGGRQRPVAVKNFSDHGMKYFQFGPSV